MQLCCHINIMLDNYLKGSYILLACKGEGVDDSSPKKLSQAPLSCPAKVIPSDGGAMRTPRGQLLLGGLVCLAIATILVMVLFDSGLAQYAR